jgi:pimeloyl-ACP methyl ester carboxylesterase
VLVDAGVRSPDDDGEASALMMSGRPVLYPDAETARNRFRLQPPQPCANAFLVEYIARTSVMRIDDGWAFKFDTDLLEGLSGLSRDDAEQDLRALTLPLGLIYGADSKLFSGDTLAYMQELQGAAFPAVAIPAAQHHLFLDQPQAFVEALAEMLPGLRSA